MAYQRPFLISMKKSDPHQPWGFRTFGGKDYGEPHVVDKVLEDSNAERCGLRPGDEIIQIGRINVQDMTFGQVQEILARCGNKIEMFIIREDLLSPRKGKEPPFVKAVVHNPYNSPLNLYSTENIAETLAKQTEVLTEGHIAQEEGPENLSFKQKSAVFQLLEEQAKQEITNQHHPKSTRQVAPPEPRRIVHHNKEYDYLSDNQQVQKSSFPQQYTTAHGLQPISTQANPAEYRKETVSYQQQNIHNTETNYGSFNSAKTLHRVEQPPPRRNVQTSQLSTMATSCKQQPQYYNQQYQEEEASYHNTIQEQQEAQHLHKQKVQQQQQQYEQKFHQPQQQQQYEQKFRQPQQQQQYEQKLHQPQQQQNPKVHQNVTKFQPQVQKVDPIFEFSPQPVGEPMSYKAPPMQKHKVNWPPQSPEVSQQNGRWSTPSPTPASPSRNIEDIWPPKRSTMKELPRSGFSPSALREQGAGRRCVWPPAKPEEEHRVVTPQSPVSGRRIAFNPSPSPPLTRRALFGSVSPVCRRKDIAWPPPSPPTTKTDTFHQRPSPTLTRKARFEEYVHQNTSNNVPTSYRPPPGTQHVQYC